MNGPNGDVRSLLDALGSCVCKRRITCVFLILSTL